MARGDHLFYYRSGSTYSHHGIDVGDGSVIHYESSTWMKLVGRWSPEHVPRVCQTSGDEFSAGNAVHIRMYINGDTQAEVLSRAQSRIGETAYDLFHNNCEHFAVWCKTGVAHSTQVDAFEQATRAMARAKLLSLPMMQVARRLPTPYRAWAYGGAAALSGSAFVGTYVSCRWRQMRERQS